MIGELPSEPSTFLGRDSELAELSNVQRGARLLTLVGPSGVGKTRLGLRLAGLVSRRYADGVWFVDLASVAEPSMVPHIVARALDVREEPGRSALQAVATQLRDRHALLILDNCERVLDACADLALTLFACCPNLHLVAISREPLAAEGDTIWRVPHCRCRRTALTTSRWPRVRPSNCLSRAPAFTTSDLP